MEEKISVAEISRLREFAKVERKKHQFIMRRIEQQKSEETILSPEEQMEIVKRGNTTEIRSMLEAFGINHLLSSEVQIYIYNHSVKEDRLCDWMLKNCLWSLELEKILIDNNAKIQRKLSPQAEVYLLKQNLETSQNLNNLSYIEAVEIYLHKHELSLSGQKELMSYLNLSYGRDSLIDKCKKIVKDYIFQYKNLNIVAQRLLIQSGNHDVIMHYIQDSIKGLEAEEELLERGNRKEVEAYFARYATM